MKKKELHPALVFLMQRLSEIKDNPVQDKHFVESLTTVLRYFRDNGELRQALEIHKEGFKDIDKSPWCKMLLTVCNTSFAEFEGMDAPKIDIDKIIEKITSNEHIDQLIKDVLGE